nr:DegV family protein [uncultured Intestinibacter sp.]
MSRIGIVTDSHSSITQDEADRLGIKILPMPFYIGGECYYEGKNITRNELMEKLINQEDISTSQPSPEDVMNLWDGVLEEYDNILYMPLSSGLSGSYSTAAMLAQEEKYKEKVYVVDHGRISTPLHQSILDALEMIEEGLSASEIKLKLEQAKQKMAIFIDVDDLKYLRRGGRISSGADDETTQRWVQDIKEAFPGHEVMCDYLSFGVTCHTGPGALGIGFSCRP